MPVKAKEEKCTLHSMVTIAQKALGDLRLPADPLAHQGGGVNIWNVLPTSVTSRKQTGHSHHPTRSKHSPFGDWEMALPTPSLACRYPIITFHGVLEDTAEPTQGQLSELRVYSGTHGCELWKDPASRCSEGHVGVVGVGVGCWRPSQSELSQNPCQD